ncbi:MAG: hypothetical protein ACLGG7_11950 [Bacteriovoracia bacterium]
MKTEYHRILVVQSVPELAEYTCGLLDDIGFRHIARAETAQEATELLRKAKEGHRQFQAIVCDDDIRDGALALIDACDGVPLLAISDPANDNNLQLAARLGLSGLIFRPYGRAQFETALAQLLAG